MLSDYSDEEWSRMVYIMQVGEEIALWIGRGLAKASFLPKGSAKKGLIARLRQELDYINALRAEIGWSSVEYIGEVLQAVEHELQDSGV